MHHPRYIAAAFLILALSPLANAHATETTDTHAPASLQRSTTPSDASSLGASPQVLASTMDASKWPGNDPMPTLDGKRHKKRHRHPHPGDPGGPGNPGDNGGGDPAPPTPTPEPGTLLLLGATASAIGLRNRLRSRRR